MRGGIRRGDDETIFIHVIEQRKIVALPIAVRARAVNAEDEGDFFARLQVARIIQEVGPAGLHFDYRALVDHSV